MKYTAVFAKSSKQFHLHARRFLKGEFCPFIVFIVNICLIFFKVFFLFSFFFLFRIFLYRVLFIMHGCSVGIIVQYISI